MGLFDYYKQRPSANSLFNPSSGGRLNLSGLDAPRLTSRQSGIPNRFDLNDLVNPVASSPVGQATGFNKFVDDLSQKGVEGFGALFGTLPARVAETPFSLGDTALKRVGIDVGKSPVGGVVGAAGEVVNRVGNFMPALLNSHDAEIFKAVGDLPDNTPITDELVRQKLGMGDKGLFGPDLGEGAGGLPILGIFGIGNRPKTVGEFKAELAKRRFFTDKDGKPVDPAELLNALRTGKSTFDFGDKSINDSPLVDMAGRLALDPTNALFLVPGGALAKVGLKGIGEAASVLPRARLVEAGALATKLPRPVIAAEAIAKGDLTMGTLKGLGELFKGGAESLGRLGAATVKRAADPRTYLEAADGTSGLARLVSRGRSFQKSSLALGATNIAVNRVTGLVNDALGGNTPLKWVQDFTGDVENDRPLSENSAWMLASAIAFPYGEVIGGAASKVKQEKVRLLGRNEYDDLVRAAGGHQQLLEKVGGEQGLQNLLYFLDKQYVRPRLDEKVIKNIVGSEAIPDATVRLNITENYLQGVVDQFRADGKIGGKQRYQMLTDWARDQGGFTEGIDFNPTFDDILRRWQQFQPIQEFVGPELRAHGEFISGLRKDVMFTEQVDLAADQLRQAAKNGIVPKEAIMRVMGDVPQLNLMDRLGFWEQFVLPDAKAPTLRRVQDVLKRQREQAVPIKDYFADVIQNEKDAPGALPTPDQLFESPSARVERLRAELDTTTDPNGTILPEQVERAHQIQRELEDALAKQDDIAWVKRGEAEQAAGVDPTVSRRLQDEASKDLGAPDNFPADADSHSEAMKAWQRNLDYEIAQRNPSYTVTYAPTQRVIAALRPDDADFIRAVDHRTALGDWVTHEGPLSSLSRMYDALFGSRRQSDIHREAKQALYNEFIPLGANSKQVDRWVLELHNVVEHSTFEIGGQKLELLRGIRAIPATMLVKKARETLPKKVLDKLSDRDIINRFDRAGSGFYRKAHAGVNAGSKMSAVLEAFYKTQQNLPGSGVRRLVSRTLYPLFRFMLDPRWLLLNAVEAQMIGAKDGIIPIKDTRGPLSRGAEFFLAEGKVQPELNVIPDSGWLFGKRYATYVSKAWEKRSLDTIEAAFNQIGHDAPELAMMRQFIRREADMQLAKGLIDEATHQKRYAASNREIGEYINDFLYRQEKRGVKGAVEKTVTEEAENWMTREEREVMAPLLTKIAERNVELWSDVKHTFLGNTDRSRVERVMNSYWLYWPISYQIKAAKWLGDIMLNGSFGHDNGALLAGKYALWQQQHVDRMKKDASYAAMFEQNKNLWFIAQMLLPITPEDIGTSLSRPTRLAGASAQDAVNDMLGTRLGAFTAYKQLQDGVIPSVTWITDLGPLYTQELLNRLSSDQLVQDAPLLATSGSRTQ